MEYKILYRLPSLCSVSLACTVVAVKNHTAILVEPPIFTLKSTNMKQINSINVSWIQQQRSLMMPDIKAFSLRIDHGSRSRVMSLNNSYYHFTAPEGAPPCEVYNFSVTATHVGATYIGASCSVPSPVLSTMLPSLPNISQLESSLGHVLEKRSTGFFVDVFFEVCCNTFKFYNNYYSDPILFSYFCMLKKLQEGPIGKRLHNASNYLIVA